MLQIELVLSILSTLYVVLICCCVLVKCVVYKKVHNCSADILGPIIEGNHSCCKKRMLTQKPCFKVPAFFLWIIPVKRSGLVG